MNAMIRTILAVGALCAAGVATAQVAETDPLFARAMEMDKRLFEEGFNLCNAASLDAVTDAKLDFFHDVGGPADRTKFLADMKQHICGPGPKKPIRTLVAGSSKVFPLKKDGKLYGFIHHGDHEFWLREPGKPDVKTGFARFTSVWIESEGAWRLRTALSYDHGPAR